MDVTAREFSDREKEITAWLGDEYASLQSGRATPSLVGKVRVSAYGAATALTHCAAVSAESATTITVTPYDASLLPDIETAIRDQVPSVSVATDGALVRVTVPEMSGDRRELLEKLVGRHAEEAKRSVRGLRERLLSDLGKSDLSKDESFRVKKEVQDLVDRANETIEGMREQKVRDIQQ